MTSRSQDQLPPYSKFKYGQWVEKYTGEAIWKGQIVSCYMTMKNKIRYVVDVHPQGFQMICIPSQLRCCEAPNDE